MIANYKTWANTILEGSHTHTPDCLPDKKFLEEEIKDCTDPATINRWLAELVMGYALGGFEDDHWYIDSEGNSVIRKSDWNPWEDLNQSYQCVDALKDVDAGIEFSLYDQWVTYSDELKEDGYHNHYDYYAEFTFKLKDIGYTELKRSQAICKAVLIAGLHIANQEGE